jgi:competence protein ComEA
VDALNQAATLRDGDPAAPPPGLSSTEPAVNSEGGPININTATAAQLEQLPGIGPSRAQDIIDNRPYESVDELDSVSGIGPATLEELRPYVVVE